MKPYPAAKKPRVLVARDGTYVYVRGRDDDVLACEEWERCHPPQGPAPKDSRETA